MGYITILTGPRKVALMIPPMFKHSADLLHRLKSATLAKADVA